MGFARPNGFKIDFLKKSFSGSAAWFFVIILKTIFTPIFEIKIREIRFLDSQKIHFRKPTFINKRERRPLISWKNISAHFKAKLCWSDEAFNHEIRLKIINLFCENILSKHMYFQKFYFWGRFEHPTNFGPQDCHLDSARDS